MANSKTKVITGVVRLSYAHVLEPVAPLSGDGPAKYSASIIIPKSDTETINKIKAAIDVALEEAVATKFGGKKLNASLVKVLRDGDVEREEDENYKDSYFVNAKSTTQPEIVDKNLQPILDKDEIYSGMYARVSLSFYGYNVGGQKGVACGLGNIQKIKDGEKFGTNHSAANDFSTVGDDFI